MTDLYWPGDHRADAHATGAALLAALVRVEVAWLEALVDAGVAPAQARRQLAAWTWEPDREAVERLAAAAEAGATLVIPAVELMRAGLEEPAAGWLHRGLTSQDVLDTALVLVARDAVAHLRDSLAAAVRGVADLADRHRSDVMVARTLTQHAVPTTFGLVASGWLTGLLDALDDLATLRWPAQLGGAAGTRAAVVELAGPDDAGRVVTATAAALGLDEAAPWQTVRSPLTRAGDALTRVTDACGHLAADVLVLSRPEIGELREGTPGGSSTMPGKANPVLAAQVRRAALTTPGLAAQLHLAAADSHDQRTAGAWHTEAATLRDLLRRTLVAAAQTSELVRDLVVDTDRMGSRAHEAEGTLRAEQRSMAHLTGRDPAATYLGTADDLVDAALDRARTTLEVTP